MLNTSINILVKGNATVHDQERRRIWLGTIARCVKRSGVSKSDSSTLSRIPQFITDQLQWAITGILPSDRAYLIDFVKVYI